MARLARGNVDMPKYDGFPIHVQVTIQYSPPLPFQTGSSDSSKIFEGDQVWDLRAALGYGSRAAHELVQHPLELGLGGISAQKRRYLPLPTICCSQSNSVVLIFSLGLFSYSDSPYPQIIVQPLLVPRTPL